MLRNPVAAPVRFRKEGGGLRSVSGGMLGAGRASFVDAVCTALVRDGREPPVYRLSARSPPPRRGLYTDVDELLALSARGFTHSRPSSGQVPVVLFPI